MTNLGRVSQALKVDHSAAHVVQSLSGAAVPTILLKGSTLDFLHVGRDPRWYVDVDVLVPVDQLERAETTLRSLGYRHLLEGSRPMEGPPHARTWIRDGTPSVDLHYTLFGVAEHPTKVWRTLSSHVRPHVVAGITTRALDRPGCAMHVALHTAVAGTPLTDLERAVEVLDHETWREAEAIAASIGGLEPFRAGLYSVAAGAALARTLDIPAPSTARWAMSRDRPRGTDVLIDLTDGSLVSRLRRVATVLFPSDAVLKLASPLARRGRLGTVLARLARPFLLLRRLPAAVRSASRRRR